MNQQPPRLPKPGEFVRGVGTLREVMIIPPPPQPPPKTVYIFEYTTAESRLLLNGEVVRTFATYNDHNGKETSVQAAIEDAEKYVRRHNLNTDSDLEVIVVRMVHRSERALAPRTAENFYDNTYVALQPSCVWDEDETEEVVWSSKVKEVPK